MRLSCNNGTVTINTVSSQINCVSWLETIVEQHYQFIFRSILYPTRQKMYHDPIWLCTFSAVDFSYTTAILVKENQTSRKKQSCIFKFSPWCTVRLLSILVLSTFHSWEVIFHLRRPMAFYLSAHKVHRACSSYECFNPRARRLSSKLLQ